MLVPVRSSQAPKSARILQRKGVQTRGQSCSQVSLAQSHQTWLQLLTGHVSSFRTAEILHSRQTVQLSACSGFYAEGVSGIKIRGCGGEGQHRTGQALFEGKGAQRGEIKKGSEAKRSGS